MTTPEPPDYFNGAARAAWYRLHANLLARGAWNDLDVIGLELVAMACAGYMSGACQPDSDPKLVEEARLSVRRMLAEFLYIKPERIPLATLTQAGLDADIAGLCEPLEKEPR